MGATHATSRPSRRLPAWGWAAGLYLLVRLVLAPIAAALDPPPLTFAPQPADNPLQRALVSPWERWDVEYYVKIARDGYGVEPKTRNFYPLYPWLARWPALLFGGNWLLGLLLVGGLATIALYLLIERLALGDGMAPGVGRWAAVCLTLLPSAFILYAPYTESLFLACAAACLLLARQNRWWWAAAAAFAATLTRQQGIVLGLPLLWEMRRAAGGWRMLLSRWRWWPALAAPPLALVALVVYRAIFLDDLPPDWWLPRNWIYAIFVSPNAQSVVPGQRFLPPWSALAAAIGQWLEPADLTHSLARTLDLICGAIYLGLLLAFWRRLRPGDLGYCLAIFALALAYHTGPLFAYMGLGRHLLLAFPLAFPLAEWSGRSPARRLLVIVLGGGLLLIQTIFYLKHWWVA